MPESGKHQPRLPEADLPASAAPERIHLPPLSLSSASVHVRVIRDVALPAPHPRAPGRPRWVGGDMGGTVAGAGCSQSLRDTLQQPLGRLLCLLAELCPAPEGFQSCHDLTRCWLAVPPHPYTHTHPGFLKDAILAFPWHAARGGRVLLGFTLISVAMRFFCRLGWLPWPALSLEPDRPWRGAQGSPQAAPPPRRSPCRLERTKMCSCL